MAPPDSGNQRQLLRQRQMSTDEVMVETPDIVTFFIANRVEAQGHTVPEEMRAVTVNDEVASCLRQVGKLGIYLCRKYIATFLNLK